MVGKSLKLMESLEAYGSCDGAELPGCWDAVALRKPECLTLDREPDTFLSPYPTFELTTLTLWLSDV